MNYSALTEILSKNIGAYKLLLINILSKNEVLAGVISKTYHNINVGIVEWIENTQANSFFDFSNKWIFNMKPLLSFNQIIYTDVEMDCINTLIGQNPKNYFNEIEFKSLESLERKWPYPYYIYDDKVLKELDFDFFQLIDGYSDIGGARQRKISEKVSINLVPASNRIMCKSIETYCFPEIYVVVNENEYRICEEVAVTSLLFLGDNCFNIFIRNRLEPIVNDSGQVISMLNKTDEPSTFSNSVADTYCITNSEKAKEDYNRFINLSLALSALFFNIFEEWLVKEVVDQLEASNDL